MVPNRYFVPRYNQLMQIWWICWASKLSSRSRLNLVDYAWQSKLFITQVVQVALNVRGVPGQSHRLFTDMSILWYLALCLQNDFKVHIAHRSWQHCKMKFLWRYGRELCYTLELMQTLYAWHGKENGVDFYNSVFPGEVQMCLVFMSFRFKIIKRVLSFL